MAVVILVATSIDFLFLYMEKNCTQNVVICAHCMTDKMYFFFPGGDAELELVDSLDPFSEVIRIIERVMQRSLNLNLDEEKLRFIES